MPELSVSVVIPTYNRARLIDRAITSALSQLQDGDEIIVVDDDSSDDTADVVSRHSRQVRYVKIPNRGAGGARNRGIREASGDLVAFLDSDDEWMPHKLTLQRTLMAAHPDLLFAFSNFAATDNQGKATRRFLAHWHHDSRPWDEILGPGRLFSSLTQLPAGCDDFRFYVGDLSSAEITAAYVLTSSMIARRVEAGGALHFAEDVATLEDYECFGRLALAGPAAYMDIETTWQHGHSGERLTDFADLRRTSAQLTILERVWGGSETFVTKHGALYEQVRETCRLAVVRDLISLGRTAEARKELRSTLHAPFSYRVLAQLPGAGVKALLWSRRAAKQSLRALGHR